MKNYTCAICGTEHTDLDSYVDCVRKCSRVLKEEEKKKRLEEVNAALSKVKAAKAYYEEQLDIFKEKYPKEYEINFGFGKTKIDDYVSSTTVKANEKSITANNNVDKAPNDPDVKYIMKLLGMI